jgi:hypothetical protein
MPEMPAAAMNAFADAGAQFPDTLEVQITSNYGSKLLRSEGGECE